MKYLIIVLLWTAYCALHSYLISIRFTNLMIRLLKSYYRFYRLFYILISLALLIPLLNYIAQIDTTRIIEYGQTLSIVRRVLMYGSLFMFFWAFFFDYDALSFFGIRQIIEYGKDKDKNLSGEIKKKGLLGVMRHPMYFALIIYLWCNTFKLSDIVTNIVLTVYILIGTWFEERKLVLEFGESYTKYQQEVPMLIPFLKI